MARSEARISVGIWDDDDFLDLNDGAQRMFMFLISQVDLSHAGILPLRERRWSRMSRNLDLEKVTAALAELADARFIVIDWDTEEVLIRSFMRRDKVYRQPNVLRSALDSLPLVKGSAIRQALAVEVERIADLEDIPEGSAEPLAAIRKVLAEDLAKTSRNPSGNPSDKGLANPNGGTPGERGIPQSVLNDSPFPFPRDPEPLTPNPASAEALTLPLAPLADEQPATTKPKRNRTPKTDNPEADPDFMRFWNAHPHAVAMPDSYKHWKRATSSGKRSADQLVIDAAALAEHHGREQTPLKFIPQSHNWLREERWRDRLPTGRDSPKANGRHASYQNPTDDSIYEGAL